MSNDSDRSNDDGRTRPDEVTRGAERSEADAGHVAGRPATGDEAAAADEGRRHLDLEDVAAHEREMAERGAHEQGEGRPS